MIAFNPQKHTKTMQEKFQNNIQQSIDKSLHYVEPIDPLEDFSYLTEYIFEPLTSTEAVFKYASKNPKTAVLNFASYKNPGGGFIKGAMAQEESLCRDSTLYNVLSKMEDIYRYNKQHLNDGFYTNSAIYSPNITFVSEGSEVTCNVITCAAPNFKAAQQKFYNGESKYIQYCKDKGITIKDLNSAFLKSRISFLFSSIHFEKVDTLILGAWGCGVFQQDPKEVARLFRMNLEGQYAYRFKKIIFAIPDAKILGIFKKAFDVK